ncbi:septum site-determining protein Ssd [Mycolicibacterium psychrotolerans]|uniref:septum site-determining protein Ssd n=1 Tax=Mycolicibacterium psychrotolerans TaxID=216929 RepID=UPI0021F2CA36|nr:septum site-determining protein Ssd [Mycolicibacterium psychrotolerans]
MSTPAAILILVEDATLTMTVDRVVAAAGLQVVRAADTSNRRAWTGAAAVLLDAAAARRCAGQGLPTGSAPEPAAWEAAVTVGAEAAVTVGAQRVLTVAVLAEAAEAARDGGARGAVDGGARGAVVAVMSGRGGGGASVFAVALARTAAEALLVDGDPWGGGLDLVLGSETEQGLRWPDLTVAGGRLTYPALRDALPRRHGVSVLSGSRVLSGERPCDDIDPLPLDAVIDAGSRGGVTVVCDVARRPAPATDTALAAADLVVLVTPADVRSCAAAAATGQWVASSNPNTGVLVRGPAPGGLRPVDVARIVGLPLLASMRPQPGIEQQLERGGLRMPRRSPLAVAARTVLAVLQTKPAGHDADAAA